VLGLPVPNDLSAPASEDTVRLGLLNVWDDGNQINVPFAIRTKCSSAGVVGGSSIRFGVVHQANASCVPLFWFALSRPGSAEERSQSRALNARHGAIGEERSVRKKWEYCGSEIGIARRHREARHVNENRHAHFSAERTLSEKCVARSTCFHICGMLAAAILIE
jgi:hypothetical protein